MKSNVFEVGMILLLTAVIFYIGGIISGIRIGTAQKEREAVKIGVAEYVLIGNDGEYPQTVFVWKTNLVK